MSSEFGRHALWSYGTGNPGSGDGQLFGPHMAEENPFDPDEIVVAEQWGSDIVLINRKTGKLRTLFGERGVPGDGERINLATSAHFMPSGPYEGHLLITEFDGEHRVMIVDRDSGGVMWCYTECQRPFEAIYWDDDHIMVSDGEEIIKIMVKDKTVVWNYPAWRPFYLQKLLPKKYGVSYGGDLLIPFVSGNPTGVWEIDTSTGEKVWSYGDRKGPGHGDLYDMVPRAACALRFGIHEKFGGFTIICSERSRILCVNRDKELVWELGGGSGDHLAPATPYAVLPTYISPTTRGTLLVTDWGLNMIYEIDPFRIPPRMEKDAYLFRDDETTDQFSDSGIMESRGYRDMTLQVFNRHAAAALNWRVLGSHNTRDWQLIESDAAVVDAGQSTRTVITEPWNFIKVQAKSAADGTPSTVDAYVTLRR